MRVECIIPVMASRTKRTRVRKNKTKRRSFRRVKGGERIDLSKLQHKEQNWFSTLSERFSKKEDIDQDVNDLLKEVSNHYNAADLSKATIEQLKNVINALQYHHNDISNKNKKGENTLIDKYLTDLQSKINEINERIVNRKNPSEHLTIGENHQSGLV